MLQNLLKVAFRNLWRNKVYSFINIFGLAVGLSAGMLLLLWVRDELSFDRFHQNPEKLFRLSVQTTMDGKQTTWNTTPAPLPILARKEVPGIEKACLTYAQSGIGFRYKNNVFVESRVANVEETFFEMFHFPLIQGNPRQPFSSAYAVVLTASTAKKYFGNDDPIGKILRVEDTYNVEVSGIIADMPDNATQQYDIIGNFEITKARILAKGEGKKADSDWDDFSYDTYFQLTDPASAPDVVKKLTLIHERNRPDIKPYHIRYLLQNITRVHLYGADGTGGGIRVVQLMALVAGIILLIACINYVNLATARASKRAKEVSMRKIAGANGSQLFAQFLGESVLVFTLSLALAGVLITLLVPVYNDLANKHLRISLLDPAIIAMLGGTLALTLLLAGAYPAWVLSRFKPVEVMRGVGHSSGGKHGWLRKSLVVVQFSFSILLIISTLVIGRQLDFIRQRNLGYDKENVLTFGMREMNKHYEVAKTELLRQPGVLGVTASGMDILDVDAITGAADWDGKDPKRMFLIRQLPVDKNFVQVMGLKLTQGTGFTGTPADSTNYLLNETAIALMGIKDPVGKRFTFHEKNGVIAGVVKDFHHRNLREKIEPLILFYQPGWRWKMYVKTSAQDAPKVVAAAEKIFKQYNANYPFAYGFLDDDFNKVYRADQTLGRLFNFFAGIAIFISCMGLFGLATFTAEARTKEIGIRKVLGASVANIVTMLSKDFVKLVGVSTLLAFPIAWLALNKLLESYAYRIQISWPVFVLAGALALLIALLTVSYQAVKAALANPVKSLRTE